MSGSNGSAPTGFKGHQESGLQAPVKYDPPSHTKAHQEEERKKAEGVKPGETITERDRRIQSDIESGGRHASMEMKSSIAGASMSIASKIIMDARSRRTETILSNAEKNIEQHGHYARRYDDAVQRYFDMGTQSGGGNILDEMSRKHGKTRKEIVKMLKSPSAQKELGLSDNEFGKLTQHVQSASMMPDVRKARQGMLVSGASFAKNMHNLSDEMKNTKKINEPTGLEEFTQASHNIHESLVEKIMDESAEPIEVENNDGIMDSLTKTLETFNKEMQNHIEVVGENIGNGFKKP